LPTEGRSITWRTPASFHTPRLSLRHDTRRDFAYALSALLLRKQNGRCTSSGVFNCSTSTGRKKGTGWGNASTQPVEKHPEKRSRYCRGRTLAAMRMAAALPAFLNSRPRTETVLPSPRLLTPTALTNCRSIRRQAVSGHSSVTSRASSVSSVQPD